MKINIIIGIIVLAVVSGASLIWLGNTEQSSTSNETQKSTPIDEAEIVKWTTYQSSFLSLDLPADAIVEKQQDTYADQYIKIKSPQLLQSGVPLYQIILKLYKPERYVSMLDYSAKEKNRILEAINTGDLQKLTGYDGASIYDSFNYNEIFMLNGKKAFITFSGNDKVLYAPRLLFLSEQMLIELKISDLVLTPNLELIGKKDNFISVFNKRVYGRTLNSIKINF